jgi:hypothetical protein
VSINGLTGTLAGTLSATADVGGPYQVTVTATDGVNSVSQTFTWFVSPVVSLNAISDQSNAVGDSVSLAVSASDANNATLSYSATGLPPGVTISSTTGLITGSISLGAESGSPYAVTVTASDGTFSSSLTFNWSVSAVALVNPGAQMSMAGSSVSLALQGGDADGDAVSYTAVGLPLDWRSTAQPGGSRGR